MLLYLGILLVNKIVTFIHSIKKKKRLLGLCKNNIYIFNDIFVGKILKDIIVTYLKFN